MAATKDPREREEPWDDRLGPRPVPQADRKRLAEDHLYPDLCERLGSCLVDQVKRGVAADGRQPPAGRESNRLRK